MAGYSSSYGKLLPSDVETDGDSSCKHLESRVPILGLDPHKSDSTMHGLSTGGLLGKIANEDRVDSVCDSGFHSGLVCLSSQRDSGLEITSLVEDLHLSGTDGSAKSEQNKVNRDSGLDEDTSRWDSTDHKSLGYHSQSLEETTAHPQILEIFEYQDDDGDSRLHLAIIHQMSDLAEHLISLTPSSSYLNLQNALYQTPLHLAVLTNQPHIVRKLVVWGADLEVRDRHGNTALHLACQRGQDLCIMCLTFPMTSSELESVPFKVPERLIPQNMDIKNYDGETCLHVTLCLSPDSQIKILHYLVNKCGADINSMEGKSGRTMLHEAVDANNCQLTKYLLTQSNVRVDACTYGGYTPLRLAASRGYTAITEMLVARGADKSRLALDDYESSDSDNDSMDDISYDDNDMCIAGQPISL